MAFELHLVRARGHRDLATARELDHAPVDPHFLTVERQAREHEGSDELRPAGIEEFDVLRPDDIARRAVVRAQLDQALEDLGRPCLVAERVARLRDEIERTREHVDAGALRRGLFALGGVLERGDDAARLLLRELDVGLEQCTFRRAQTLFGRRERRRLLSAAQRQQGGHESQGKRGAHGHRSHWSLRLRVSCTATLPSGATASAAPRVIACSPSAGSAISFITSPAGEKIVSAGRFASSR